MLAVAEQVLANIKVTEDGTRIRANIKMPKGLPALAKAMVPLLGQLREFLEEKSEQPQEVE